MIFNISLFVTGIIIIFSEYNDKYNWLKPICYTLCIISMFTI